MDLEKENRLGLAGQTSQIKIEMPQTTSSEWPAFPVEEVEVRDASGAIVTMSFADWLAKTGNNNRGGT